MQRSRSRRRKPLRTDRLTLNLPLFSPGGSTAPAAPARPPQVPSAPAASPLHPTWVAGAADAALIFSRSWNCLGGLNLKFVSVELDWLGQFAQRLLDEGSDFGLDF